MPEKPSTTTGAQPAPLRVLALEPYYGGSHRAFLDGWSSRSRHAFTLLTLPAHSWKWRMRQAAIAFAQQLRNDFHPDQQWDILFCSDMLNLAEFRGLAPAPISTLPSVAYFHENQLTYPTPRGKEPWDAHFAITNFTTCLAADQIWFNSAFHRDDFLAALPPFFAKTPGRPPREQIETLPEKSLVLWPGFAAEPRAKGPRTDGPLRIVWAARWEHDKAPEIFFEAMTQLKKSGHRFEISVLGESFRQQPAVFETARTQFASSIRQWGFLPREAYVDELQTADVFVSTAEHEFFGIAAMEAMAAGCFPLLPRRLSYPELLGVDLSNAEQQPLFEEHFYAGDCESLAAKLAELIGRVARGELWPTSPAALSDYAGQFAWPRAAMQLDAALDNVLS